jgi:hypothetical protein
MTRSLAHEYMKKLAEIDIKERLSTFLALFKVIAQSLKKNQVGLLS